MTVVPLVNGRGVLLIDDEDFAIVQPHSWRLSRLPHTSYAVTGVRSMAAHRLILGVTDPKIDVDHVNHDGLDCRRANLRIATRSQNMHNRKGAQRNARTSRYVGVYWEAWTSKWRASITVDGRDLKLGRFTDEDEAARAYDAASREFCGGFGYLNLPQRGGDAHDHVPL